MGNDIAIAEKPFRKLQSKPSSLSGLSLGGQEVSFKSEAEKDLFVEMVEIAEMQARSTMTNVRYPVIAGSDGVTIFLEKGMRLLQLQQPGQQHMPMQQPRMVGWYVLVQPQKTHIYCNSYPMLISLLLRGYGLD